MDSREMSKKGQREGLKPGPKDEGIVLLGALILVLLLSLLGMASLHLASQEVVSAASIQDDKVVQQLAESASEVVMSWFHDPTERPAAVAELISKRYDDPVAGPSYFDAVGRSQYVGSFDHPDILFDAARTADAVVLNDPQVGAFRSLRGLGRILRLKVYGPMTPGLLCTVHVTAGTLGNDSAERTMSMQLGALTIPPLRAPVQLIGQQGAQYSLPVAAHWGDVKVAGDVMFRHADEIPTQSNFAPVTGQSYDEVNRPEDRWLRYWIGGNVTILQPVNAQLPLNMYSNQIPSPGVRFDTWNYDLLKKTAIRFGTYYGVDREGLLYPNGLVEPGRGISPDEALRSGAVGDHRGLIFIDTLDQQPPHSDNMATIVLSAEYAEAILVIQNHLVWKPRGQGQSVPALSPSHNGQASLATRIPVQLSGLHFNGVLHVTGNLTVEGMGRMYGGLSVGGTAVPGSADGRIEVWYNADLGKGLYRGLPVVYRAPGTWQMDW